MYNNVLLFLPGIMHGFSEVAQGLLSYFDNVIGVSAPQAIVSGRRTGQNIMFEGPVLIADPKIAVCFSLTCLSAVL